MGLKIEIEVGGRPGLEERWQSLQTVDGIESQHDRSTLVLAVPRGSDVAIPSLGVPLAVRIDGWDVISHHRIVALSGDTKRGTITVHGGAVAPLTTLREPRCAAWSGQTLGEIAEAMAARAGLIAHVTPSVSSIVPDRTTQWQESDQQFLWRTAANLGARCTVKNGRLIILMAGDTRGAGGASLPPFELDLQSGARMKWERHDRSVEGTVLARYYSADGSGIDLVRVGAGRPFREVPGYYQSKTDARLAAGRALASAAAGRDVLQIETAFSPGARAGYPLRVQGAPSGFASDLTIHEVRHTLGSHASATSITAREARFG